MCLRGWEHKCLTDRERNRKVVKERYIHKGIDRERKKVEYLYQSMCLRGWEHKCLTNRERKIEKEKLLERGIFIKG
jgi:hypothetical protein